MKRTLTLVVLFLIALPPAARGAGDPLDEAKAERDAALAEAGALGARIDALAGEVGRVRAKAERATAALIDTYRAGLEVDRDLDAARDRLGSRARTAYMTGPAGLLGAYLQATEPADLALAQIVIDRTILGDVDAIAGVLDDRGRLDALNGRAERRRRAVLRELRRAEPLLAELEILLARARDEARRSGRRVRALERQGDALTDTAQAVAEIGQIAIGGVDQTELLAMLGPDGGRGCDIPEGLTRTGEGFAGISSWYGWDFAGRPTASGAIYDPRLFTAAHKTLPLPTFLHVRHAGRCATVLVNDRGPFIEGRVLDLSQGSAEYLGVGLNHVQAEILVPAE